MTRELKWGETPWDDLSREDLLRTVQKMWAALDATASCLRMAKAVDPISPYWGSRGAGGRALEMTRQVQGPVLKSEEYAEQLWRMFFRYAVDLLFEDTDYRVRSGWMVCDKDKQFWGRVLYPDGTERVPEKCAQCDGPVRPLAWSDLEPWLA